MPLSFKDRLRILRRAARALAGQDIFRRPDVDLPFEMHGKGAAAWAVHPDGLTGKSVVYAFGVGRDVSFDLSLIDRYGVQVHAFDPTPRSKAWISRQSLPDRFTFHNFGIAPFDGTATFRAPSHPDHVSYTMIAADETDDQAAEGAVYRLSTIMQKLGHDHVDLLKMDIEGAEYAVLDDILDAGIEVRQLLIEFHHRFSDVPVARTRASLDRLHEHGYRIFSVSPRGEEYALIRQ